ncbi:MBL fold metallo-hydrolase [Alkalimonas collagenimarina]|uniref:MBL fold metallo-hydrolase n=1 Tax=Alkalimonas collagenimarina TaxID=400390 RepID=A0ABT9H0R3_9GAMM|nr:MBL fold metallo-hydrolase [Alkalimonas collagenimarina]MDP4536915.1 MBL fold metallo-hydrolase [Alkalimonas collagenimarina]
MHPQFIHHGAVNGVTGSCHEYVIAEQYSVLVDCGLFQGDETAAGGSAGSPSIEFDLSRVQALLVTHVHIDHVGRIPYLLAAGFRGPIYCTEASAALLPLVLEDALKVGVTRDAKLIKTFLKVLQRQLVPCRYKEWCDLPSPPAGSKGLQAQVRFQVAGHILGSAYLEIRHRIASKQPWFYTVFSGDLGAPHTPLLPAPKPPYKADVVVLESTYGDREHEDRRKRSQRLQQTLLHALQDNGTVLFPAFSIGRTQELLYELEGLIHRLRGQKIHQHLRWDELQVIVDSPLAARFTAAYRQLKPHWDAEAKKRLRQGRHPLNFEQLITVDSAAGHHQLVQRLAQSRLPAVVIAASGMCEGGRVVNYLKQMLPDPVHQVVFVGYQARGTLGAAILRYGNRPDGYAMIDGEKISIRAEIISLGGYSAHADKKDLLNFVGRMRHKPTEVRIVHGDEPAKQSLRHSFLVQNINAIIAR